MVDGWWIDGRGERSEVKDGRRMEREEREERGKVKKV
jgi:hypothetical protein